MYHPTRGGVRGGRDQFKWDDVKVDKHRENYLGHSVKAPVGRWQKGKDLLWYTRDKTSDTEDAMKEEIRRVKEEEEQAMREALGLAPKRSSRPKGNRLDKHEYAELIKRGSTAEDLGAGHAEAAQVQGLGLYKGPQTEEEPSSPGPSETKPEQVEFAPAAKQEDSEDDRKGKRRRDDERRGDREKERKHEKHSGGKERRRDKHESRHDSEDKERRRRKDKQKRRHDSD
ncbi:multiple myeloma tumor-associated protein 2 homolog [Lolium rigidum]|uniref:multiple myeloma tumor-associated protein 2 homolog n=1 Tax=Lolium rigidum TaxID=89674 RepID=UPI001F5DC806|nr:multiple myeloma tumor-associated protein 2 homolog [Lolium rigidum]